MQTLLPTARTAGHPTLLVSLHPTLLVSLHCAARSGRSTPMRCRTTRSAVPCVPPLTSLPPVLKYFSVPPVALRQIDLGRARMAYVACGYRHTLAISDEGALFAFGWNACVASLQTRNRLCTMQPTRCNMHRATCNMQPTLMQHATDLDANCNPPQQHSSRSDRVPQCVAPL